MNKLSKIISVGLLGLATSLISWADEPVEDVSACQNIKLAETGWADISATTAMVSVVAEGLGYEVSAPIISVPIAFTSVAKGKVDAFLGYWSPSMDGIAAPFIKDKTIIIPEKANLEGAKYTLAVPAYTYDAGLQSFKDIAKFKKDLNAQIFGIEAGNDGNLLIQKMIKENLFNLSDFKLRESSEAAMLSQVKRAVTAKKPIVFLAWEPHPMNSQIELKYLADGDEVFGPNYGSAKVFTIISPEFQKRCPTEANLISQIRFTVQMESELMTEILENKVPAKKAAKEYLKKHPEVLNHWLVGIKSTKGEDGKVAVEKYLAQ
ncbi:choline ABC transporter substrate-binding protein [Entomomonas asaccharolytica]|uniref:Choline ABC transporter substrate-binding protein n=1 Tax=Entomomonas asaccharolytica TaxID=2785331 RepID=A0A974RWY7_9GAMM|nr:choline ABC transporter substrate-binding protein [Entomomonas asaccharolytica]QQP85640.1 choline ABC transporter substrate-binding protein [Entomomonas asaccharolytica]